MKKRTREEYIERSNIAHGFKYDYRLVPENVRAKDEVEIFCPEHGLFRQAMFNHASGKVGCELCRAKRRREIESEKRQTLAQYIVIAKSVHGDKYDYSEAYFINDSRYIEYRCKTHGKVKQRKDHHLTTMGCPKCALDFKSELLIFSLDDFITKSKEIHGDRYDYSLVDYKGSSKKVNIICKEHGVFNQVACSHWSGSGCPVCSKHLNGYRSNRAGTFYILKITEDIYKFGITCSLKRRVTALQNKCSTPISILYQVTLDDGQIIRNLESEIRDSDMERHVVDSSIMLAGHTETFFSKDLPYVMSVVNKYIAPD